MTLRSNNNSFSAKNVCNLSRTCCKKCISAPPNLKVSIPGEHAELSGLYTASATRREHGLPVWKQSGGRGWLWKADCHRTTDVFDASLSFAF
eukprot:g2564.t1